MTNRKFGLGMIVLMLVFGLTLTACTSIPKGADVVDPLTPDENSVVIYFIGFSGCGDVWDGETLVGNFDGAPLVNVAWKTTPGEHFLMANTFNWITTRADLEANKSYYLKLAILPNPVPFASDLVLMTPIPAADGEKLLASAKTITFTDAWRADNAKGKRLRDAQEQVQKAKADVQSGKLPVNMTGADGR